MTTFENIVIIVTESPITIAGSNFAVTANEEQIPKTCTVTGLFIPIGVNKTSLFFCDNNFCFIFPFYFCVKKFL